VIGFTLKKCHEENMGGRVWVLITDVTKVLEKYLQAISQCIYRENSKSSE